MGFIENDQSVTGALAMPDDFDLNPEPVAGENDASLMGAAFRRENPIVSAFSQFEFDETQPIDPEYRPWEELQGTMYEEFADRFVGARNANDVAGMKSQIDQEMEDRATIHAAGAKGFLASMGAAILSPTTLLPGGFLVKGANGVRIGSTALTVSGSAGLAASIDEIALQATQETRTGQESAMAIGGSLLLGGMLGAGFGKMAKSQAITASRQAEENLVVQQEFTEALRSVGAAENRNDMTIRREEAMMMIRRVPGLRAMMRTSPLLRTTLSEIDETRQVAAQLVETPLQYRINEEGRSVLNGDVSVETRINDRMDNDLSRALSGLEGSYRDYWADGPMGSVGRFVHPVTSRFANLTGMSEKLTKEQFMDEVGRALRSGDKHPIGQVQNAAESLRRDIFDRIKVEAEELGIFDPDLKIKNADSYFTRVYDQNKIAANLGNGTADDMLVPLRQEFMRRREAAQQNVAFDRTVENLEADQMRLREEVGQLGRNLRNARKKLVDKRTRAEGAVSREGAVGRASAALRRAMESRSDDLAARTFTDAERQSLQDAVKEARAVDRLRPRDVLKAIRDMGGIKDPRVGNKKTDIETILDQGAITIRRNDGMQADDMRASLEEAGYLPEGSTINDMLDTIKRAADGEDVFSRFELAEEVARYDAAKMFGDELQALGIDRSMSLDEIIKELPGKARNQSAQKAQAREAGRSADQAGRTEDAAEQRLTKALERLEDAQAGIKRLDDEVGPKVREDIRAARAELQKLRPELKSAKKAQDVEEFYARADDLEIDEAVLDAARSIIGLKPGQHSYHASLSSPTRARTLDVADDVLEPWLQTNAQVVMNQYFRAMVPDLEITRTFGDVNMTAEIEGIQRAAAVQMERATSPKQRRAILKESQENIRDLTAMRDRMRGIYGQPKDPQSGWVFGGRVARTLSYTGYLGGMTLSALPDVAGVLGRAGIGGAFGASIDLVTKPQRLFSGIKDMTEIGSAAEWHLQSRMMSMAEMFDQYGAGSRGERALGQIGATFSKATLMTHWNAGWKSIGGAAVASKMAKAADAVRAGNATPADLRTLSANGIEPWMAQRIAAQIDEFGDKNGQTWLPRGQNWTDQEAFLSFRRAMNREFRIMIVTPGQDKPLSFSNEFGKFFFQFKSFGFSAYERILLAGLQRTDADVLMQATAAILLGGMVSNIKADMGGFDRKEGVAYWEDAIDRSGLAGWLFEPYNIMSGATGGATSISGETVSRYQSRSSFQGLMGPSVDMAQGIYEAGSAAARGDATYRDARSLMRPLPGNNLFYLLDMFQKVEDGVSSAIGAKTRPTRN